MFEEHFEANPKKMKCALRVRPAWLSRAGRDVGTDRETPNTNISR